MKYIKRGNARLDAFRAEKAERIARRRRIFKPSTWTISTIRVDHLPVQLPHVSDLGNCATIRTESELAAYQVEFIAAWGDCGLGLGAYTENGQPPIGYKSFKTTAISYHEAKNEQTRNALTEGVA